MVALWSRPDSGTENILITTMSHHHHPMRHGLGGGDHNWVTVYCKSILRFLHLESGRRCEKFLKSQKCVGCERTHLSLQGNKKEDKHCPRDAGVLICQTNTTPTVFLLLRLCAGRFFERRSKVDSGAKLELEGRG